MQLNPQRKDALLFSLFLVLSAMFAAVTPAKADTSGTTPDNTALSACAVVSRAHEAAGGTVCWRQAIRPLRGRAILQKK